MKSPYCTSAGIAPVLTPGLGFTGTSVRYVAPCSEVPCACRPLPDGNHACYSGQEDTTSAATTAAASLSGTVSGYFCQAQDQGCVWDEEGPTFATDPTNTTTVTEIAITKCGRCRCSSSCASGSCLANPNDIDCVDYLGQRPVPTVDGSGFTISCKWCACASGQPACGSLSDPIVDCIPSTDSPCELYPPQRNPRTGALQSWISAGQPLEQDTLLNPHRVACSALCECSLDWLLSNLLQPGGACPVQDVQCTPPSVASLGYNITHFLPVSCTWDAGLCTAAPGDIFMRAPMPDPTSYETLCYDANGRLPKLIDASGVYYGVCGRTLATAVSQGVTMLGAPQLDRTTRGLYEGVYGQLGAVVAAAGGPYTVGSGLTVAATGAALFTFVDSPCSAAPTVAPYNAACNTSSNVCTIAHVGSTLMPTPRSSASCIASCFYSSTVMYLSVTGSATAAPYDLAVYCLDYDWGVRTQTLSLLDPSNGNATVSGSATALANFTDGVWVVWRSLTGPVIINAVNSYAPLNAVVGAVAISSPLSARPSAQCIDPITDRWVGGGACGHVCSIPGFNCPACECASSTCSGTGQNATCRVTQPACGIGGVAATPSKFDPSANAYVQTCKVCVCADPASCAYNEALEVNTCAPSSDCWDPLFGLVASGGNASCEIVSCSNVTAENFACFTGLCNTTRGQVNEPCVPRYCECEGPCVVTQGAVSGVCKVVGDLPCIQPPRAADLRWKSFLVWFLCRGMRANEPSVSETASMRAILSPPDPIATTHAVVTFATISPCRVIALHSATMLRCKCLTPSASLMLHSISPKMLVSRRRPTSMCPRPGMSLPPPKAIY